MWLGGGVRMLGCLAGIWFVLLGGLVLVVVLILIWLLLLFLDSEARASMIFLGG